MLPAHSSKEQPVYCVTVTFEIEPALSAAFLPLVCANAKASLEQEPGCTCFDVWTDPDAPHAVYLYEVYDNRAAFDAHLASAHFQEFDAAVAPMIASKTITTFAKRAHP